MGANSSTSIGELKDNEYLRRFVGREAISFNDPFWNQLLSFSFLPPQNSADYRLLEESTLSLCKILLTNNLQTGNVASLLKVFLTRARELKTSTQCFNSVFIWQTYNALFILRCVCKFFLETITEDSFIKQLQVSSTSKDGEVTEEPESMLELFQNALLELLVDVPVVEITYAIHLEAINALLVLLSVHMFTQSLAVKSHIYKSMMMGKCAIHACLLMKTLLHNYILQLKCPPTFQRNAGSGSFVLGLASGIWSILTLGYRGRPNSEQHDDALLANQSLLLILVLTNHCTNEKSCHNPYRQALFSFTNSQDSSSGSPTQAVATFKIDYSQVFTTLCSTMKDDQTTLLLYLLLHRNQHFRTYILSRADIEELVVPILKILYQANDRNSHHIYMALIILLILSEDELFNKAVHQSVLKGVTWYTERSLSSVSLGGLLILVVIRTIQFNMTRMRDKYLHTNCLAALANMSSQFRDLHVYVAQRIVGLFESLAKRHHRSMEQLQTATESQDPDEENLAADLLQDLAVLEEVLRMVLEIINSCLCNQLIHSNHLIYTLLYKRECFEQFRNHPTFQDIIQNIETVLTYFSSKLEAANKDLSADDVLQIIQEGSMQWPGDRFMKFPDLKFKYVEEDQPEEFFIPYVWSLVYNSSNLYWNAENIRLFNASKNNFSQ
ncbi:hypothetical protein CHUAL_010419 [Chamberlinius hualienensis]